MKRIFATALIAFCCSTVQNAQNALPEPFPFRNPALSPEERAEDLCKRLTLEEKASLMVNESRAIDRLGIPAFNWWNEALHGVGRNGTATVFPITMGMAASFDDALLEQVFTAVSDEARAKSNIAHAKGERGHIYHGLSFWTPNINIFRDPRWGRGQETYGEDPYLTSRMGVSVVKGLQGPEGHRYSKLLACAKHFAVHSGPEWNRHTFNAENISLRDLHETYLPAFKALVTEAHVAEIMCAYNRYEGDPCCGSNRLLYQILRQEWGFKGLVTSDCGAVDDFWGGHKYSPDRPTGSAAALRTGTDVECGGNYGVQLVEAVKKNLIKEEDVDVSLKRLLTARFRLGDLDPDEIVEWTSIPPSVIACDAHKELALKMARESMTLLMNKNKALPLSKNIKNVAVMGPNANDSTMQWGNYNGFPKHTITILDGIKQVVPSAQYVEWQKDVDKQVQAAAKAETVIFVGGISPRLEGEEMDVNEPGFKGGDRTMIELPQVQRDIIAALHKAGKRVVLVNCSGSAIGLVPESKNADAILQAWYGGEFGGQAVAETLFGDNNPSGKLPVTFYKDVDQLPDFQDYNMAGRTYRYFRGEPLYPFGYGLSYTTFSLGKPTYKDGKISVQIANKGKMNGTETVQVYLHRVGDNEGPIKALRAFKRVSVDAGKKTATLIDLPRSSFEWWDVNSNSMRVIPGEYDVYVSTSSRDADARIIRVSID